MQLTLREVFLRETVCHGYDYLVNDSLGRDKGILTWQYSVPSLYGRSKTVRQ